MGDLVPQDKKLVEKLLQHIGFLETTLRHGLPRCLSAGAIRFFLDAPHARESLLLAIKHHGHAAADFLVLLCELGDLGLAGDIFLAIKFHLRLHATAEDGVKGWELREPGRLHQPLHQGELARLQPRIDHLNDVHVGLLLRLVIRLAGHLDVGQRGGLRERRANFAVIPQPGLEVCHGNHLAQLGLQLIENRRELRGIGQVNGIGKKLARGKR